MDGGSVENVDAAAFVGINDTGITDALLDNAAADLDATGPGVNGAGVAKLAIDGRTQNQNAGIVRGDPGVAGIGDASTVLSSMVNSSTVARFPASTMTPSTSATPPLPKASSTLPAAAFCRNIAASTYMDRKLAGSPTPA
jgi:hypothetical protein